jgi:hypothetical protein
MSAQGRPRFENVFVPQSRDFDERAYEPSTVPDDRKKPMPSCEGQDANANAQDPLLLVSTRSA